jgi:hypothetical protein
MKHVLIKYRFEDGSQAEWHAEVARFVKAIEADPELSGKITYRAMKTPDGDYYHLATVVDQATANLLGERDFFERYTARVDEISKGTLETSPLEIIAQTEHQA